QAEDTQSNDGSIITITMTELKEERRRIQSKKMTDSDRKTVTLTYQSPSESHQDENFENSRIIKRKMMIPADGNHQPETEDDNKWDTTSIPWMIITDDSDSNGNNNETGTPYKKQHEQTI
ncbi:9324_t:CDS:2, partial [Ambispora gerdemannii]